MTDLSRRYYAALVLPFDKNGKIDEAAYRDLIQYFLQERFRSVGGLVANPEAGEIYYLTREEKRRVAETACPPRPITSGMLRTSTSKNSNALEPSPPLHSDIESALKRNCHE